MFCPQCGNHLDDGARFCAACGAQIGEVSAQTPAAEVDPAASGKDFAKKILDTLKGYIKAPKATATAAAAEKEGMLFTGIFAGINFLAVFFFLWRFVGAYVTKMGLLSKYDDIAEYIEDMELTYPILAMWAAAVAITLIGVGATILVRFLIAKLNKQELDVKQLCMEQAIHTLIPTALLVVGILLSFLVWWALVVVLGIIVVLWVVSVCDELGKSENHLIPAGLIAAVLIVAVLLTGVLANWSFGELAHDGETMNESRADYHERIKDADSVYDGASIIDTMIDTLIMVDYR